jgi:hypothetical protein
LGARYDRQGDLPIKKEENMLCSDGSEAVNTFKMNGAAACSDTAMGCPKGR